MLVLLVVQIMAQTFVRVRATDASIFDDMDWSEHFPAPSVQFSFGELEARLFMGSVGRAAERAMLLAKAAGKFTSHCMK